MDAKKHIAKLLLAVSLSALAFAMLAGATYAWFVLSTQPEVRGAKVTVGAKNTIQVAPDTVDENGSHVHGTFADYITLDDEGLGALSPVSTVDGVNWVIPQYEDLEDGGRLIGYTVETNLAHANLPVAGKEGGYAYLDFWVKSPEACRLRVSTEYLRGEPGQKYLAGSFVVTVPEVAEEEDAFVLNPVVSPAEACVRLGFLADGDEGSTRFIIYEPNANLHPDDPDDYSYHITRPLGPVSGEIQEIDVKDWVSVQLVPTWRDNRNQGFRTQLTPSGIDSVVGAQYFLTNYCLKYVPEWLIAGHFFSNTAALYAAAGESVTVSAEDLATLTMAGATEDVYICQLKADTPTRIRLFIWLEGTDSDCTVSLSESELLVRLELAGDTELKEIEGIGP